MLYDDVPAKFDAVPPALDLKLAGFISAVIAVDYNESPGVLEGIPPSRIAARAKAAAPVGALARKRGVRQVNMGNDCIPLQRALSSSACPRISSLRCSGAE